MSIDKFGYSFSYQLTKMCVQEVKVLLNPKEQVGMCLSSMSLRQYTKKYALQNFLIKIK